MIENVKELETKLGLAEGTLQEAIASDDAKTIELPKGTLVDKEMHTIRSNEDHEIFVNNLKTEQKTAGLEMAIKDYKRDNNLDFEGKTIENLIKATNTKALSDANIDPDKKIEGYINDIEVLQSKSKGWEDRYNAEVSKGELQTTQLTNDKSILSHMKGEFSMSTDRMLNVFNSEHTLSRENGTQVVMKGGEIMKDENRSPMALEAVVNGFSKEFAKNPEGGSGGGDSTGGSKGGSLDKFKKQQEDAGNSYTSLAYKQAEAKAIADGTLVIS